MAREVIEKLIDDIDGNVADETVQSRLDGTTYEIDLSRRTRPHYARRSSRMTGDRRSSNVRTGRSRTATPAKAASAKPTRHYDIVQLREWAGANDIAVPSRGRIPQSVLEQYKASGDA